ncbi:MAG: NifB/NifX family molybdenum-iron cluster-binding protein [Desulfomonilia bacterium]
MNEDAMRIAIPVYEQHVAAVADFADFMLVVDLDHDREIRREIVPVTTGILPARVAMLEDLGVDVMICGALSRPYASMAVHSGVGLIPFITGTIAEVLRAYCLGTLSDPQFLMPGHMQAQRWCTRGRCRGYGRFRGGGHTMPFMPGRQRRRGT